MRDRICFVDCQKEPPECRCRASGMLRGVDLSNGVETHVEAYYQGGVLHVTDIYEIVDGTCTPKEAKLMAEIQRLRVALAVIEIHGGSAETYDPVISKICRDSLAGKANG